MDGRNETRPGGSAQNYSWPPVDFGRNGALNVKGSKSGGHVCIVFGYRDDCGRVADRNGAPSYNSVGHNGHPWLIFPEIMTNSIRTSILCLVRARVVCFSMRYIWFGRPMHTLNACVVTLTASSINETRAVVEKLTPSGVEAGTACDWPDQMFPESAVSNMSRAL